MGLAGSHSYPYGRFCGANAPVFADLHSMVMKGLNQVNEQVKGLNEPGRAFFFVEMCVCQTQIYYICS